MQEPLPSSRRGQRPATHKDVRRYAYMDVGGRPRLEQAVEGRVGEPQGCREVG